MTVEDAFCDLYDTYGDDFNWYMIPFTQANGSFVQELKRELGEKHFLYNKQIWVVAKCESSDDVLYVTGDGTGKDTYYIFHLTYSKINMEGFPKFLKFVDICTVKEYLVQSFIENYM